MADTRGLLDRIAAFRERLDQTAPLTPPAAVTAGPRPPLAGEGPTVLTDRARRLLADARDLIGHQKKLSADHVTATADDPLGRFHRGTVGLTDAAVRLVQTFPVAAEAQLRACDGLEQLLRAVRDRLGVFEDAAAARRADRERVTRLAGLLTALNGFQPVSLAPFAELADGLLADARRAAPIRFLTAEPEGDDPAWFAARCVASHALTVGQIAARIAHLDYEWAARPAIPVVAALLMDVGMLRVPAEVFTKAGPLTADERRAVESHPRVGADLVGRLIPDAGPLVDVVLTHHERQDGTGYPGGHAGESVPPLARFLAACDMYAAMCADRPHRAAADPRIALTDCLLAAEDGKLDRDFAEYLLALGFHPVGTVVELADGRLGAVAANPASRTGPGTARPVVAVLTAADGRVLPRPDFLDLAAAERGGVVRAVPAAERRAKLGEHYPDLCG